MADPLNAGSVARRVKSVSSKSVKEVMISFDMIMMQARLLGATKKHGKRCS